MDDSFLLDEEELLQMEMLWPQQTPLDEVVPSRNPAQGDGFKNWDDENNMITKGMDELVGGDSWISTSCEVKDLEKDRSYRHMIKERLRREQQKQSYAALHSLLRPRTKTDKNSIVQTANLELKQLGNLKEDLQKQNAQLEESLVKGEEEKAGVQTISLRVRNPSSAMDSMIEVLRCLKSMGLTTRAIRSEYSVGEFSAVMQIETKIEAAVVEEAVQATLAEVEGKSLSSRGW